MSGANLGIGLKTARGLVRQGLRGFMAARNEAKGQAAVADVQGSVPGAQVELLKLDLASLASVWAAAVKGRHRKSTCS